LVSDFEDYIDENGFMISSRWRFIEENLSGNLYLRDVE